MRSSTRIASCLVACAALTCAKPASANDATFGGAGADLVPLEQTRLRMASEDIELEYRADRWQVRAVYVFENVGTAVQAVQVGFPETRCEDEDSDCKRAPFADLVTKVDGKTVQHRKGAVSTKHAWASHVSVVWLFDASFSPNTTTRIEHSYSLASGNDVGGNSFTTYVTRTGAKWAGTIGRATFTLKLPLAAHTISARGIPLKQAALEDADSAAPYVKAVFERTDWEPTGDLFFSSTTRRSEARWEGLRCSVPSARKRAGSRTPRCVARSVRRRRPASGRLART